ncbi:sulfotransferase [Algirhabdus cladophorae]|uniref:sulfotransferase n=1 Tax=Algirhabdus cladophorae TaxID=3377108 RepID=UPI003B84952C
MTAPAIMYCVGATKAGTSWLYRYLHDHPECHLRSVKELHYFDSFDGEMRDKQISQFLTNRDRFVRWQIEAQKAKQGWKVDNMQRRIDEMDALIKVIGGPRVTDQAYLEYLTQGAGDAKIVGDMTPGYSLVDENMLRRMAAVGETTKFIYLIRDPVERLWSHVRMQAKRFLQPDETVEQKAKRILNRTVNKGMETHIPARGDYRGTIMRLRATIPAANLLVEFAEALFSENGLRRVCDFLGLVYRPADVRETVHAGTKVEMNEGQRAATAHFLRHQYEWVADNVGPLPDAWQSNLAKALT